MANFTPEQIESARQARNAYLRQWRQKNKDKYKQQQLQHWIRKAEKGAEALEK